MFKKVFIVFYYLLFMRVKRVVIFIILLGLLIAFSVYSNKDSDVGYEKEKCFVDRVIDGDTLICDNRTIRLLGIDTPEKGEEYYEEAKDFLEQIEGKEIFILRDFNDLGKYKRELRYVFYEDRLINVEILEQGLGKSFMTENLKYEEKLLNAEGLARRNCLGIWKKSCSS